MSLQSVDPEVFQIIKGEEKRQAGGLELIASENFTSQACLEALGSCLTNKYSEGLPGSRYYGGNEFIDQLETLCQNRALAAFHLDAEKWGVNVQPYSGSIANFAAFGAVLQPNDRIMGLNLPAGGHLSHGFYSGNKKVNCSAIYFQSMPYTICPDTGIIDYDGLEATAKIFRPKLIIAGASAYPRDFDYKRFRAIADSVGAYLMTDMAHYAGLVASELLADPFEYSDIVTTTTHKSLRGPRAALIFFKRELEAKVNFSVFPTTQGGPHNNAIAAVCTQMREVATPEFKVYSKQVIDNCRALAKNLTDRGYELVTGGSDNHLILWNLKPLGLTGSKLETLCDACHITLNKNTVVGDKSAFTPGGVRVGTPALTSRGLNQKDFEQVGEFLHRAVVLSLEVQAKSGRKLVDFKKGLKEHDGVAQLLKDVGEFSSKFFMPGGFI